MLRASLILTLPGWWRVASIGSVLFTAVASGASGLRSCLQLCYVWVLMLWYVQATVRVTVATSTILMLATTSLRSTRRLLACRRR